jgi:hypothetical protein
MGIRMTRPLALAGCAVFIATGPTAIGNGRPVDERDHAPAVSSGEAPGFMTVIPVGEETRVYVPGMVPETNPRLAGAILFRLPNRSCLLARLACKNGEQVMCWLSPLGDINRDGVVDYRDIYSWIDAVLHGDTRADIDGNGIVNPSDCEMIFANMGARTPSSEELLSGTGNAAGPLSALSINDPWVIFPHGPQYSRPGPRVPIGFACLPHPWLCICFHIFDDGTLIPYVCTPQSGPGGPIPTDVRPDWPPTDW